MSSTVPVARASKCWRIWGLIVLLLLVFQSAGAWAEDAGATTTKAEAAKLKDDAKSSEDAKTKEEAGPSFEFVDAAAMTLSPDASGAFKFDVPIKNAGTLGAVPSLALLQDRDASHCKPENLSLPSKDLPSVGPKGVTIANATITGATLPATCFLELKTAGKIPGNTSLKQIKLSQQHLTGEITLPLSLCLGLSLLLAAVTCMAGGMSLNDKLGLPAWELDKSWTSVTTVLTSLITSALAWSALPELTKYASKGGYAGVAFLISLLVIVAPFLVSALQITVVTKKGDEETGSWLWVFLLSGALTLFAGMAQVVVLFLLFDEIFLTYGFWSLGPQDHPWRSFNIGSVSSVFLIFVLCWYISRSMYQVIKKQHAANPAPEPPKSDDLSLRKENEDPNVRKAKPVKNPAATQGPLLRWSVF